MELTKLFSFLPVFPSIEAHRASRALLLLYALALFPLSCLLPGWVSYENGPLENMEVLVLLGGALQSLYFSRLAQDSSTRGMWLPSAGVFLLLALRELSWGRVFMVQGYTDIGEPILIASSAMPYRTAIHAAAGVFALLCLCFLGRCAPWKRIFRRIPLPRFHLVLLAACAALSTAGDHHAICGTMQDQLIEEMAELLMYLVLCHTAWYYYLNIEKED